MLSRLEAAIGAREWCRSGFDMAQKVTIFLPTYDRPEMLCKTLAFLQDTPDRFPIIVADGSNDHNGRKNAVACRQAGSNVTYFHFPTPVEALPPTEIPLLEDHHKIIANYYRRYLHALDQIVTPYVVHCSDDDLLIPETVAESAEFLDQNADYVACHGMYFNFRYLTDGLEIECATYDGPSLDGNEFAIRLISAFFPVRMSVCCRLSGVGHSCHHSPTCENSRAAVHGSVSRHHIGRNWKDKAPKSSLLFA